MSFDLAIWKRSATTKTAMLAEVYEAICNGRTDHPAMREFDLPALERALQAEFGDYTKDPEMLDCPINCYRGVSDSGCWLTVHCSHSVAADVLSRVIPIALSQGLLVFDPQRQAVYGNKRPQKERRRR